MKTCDGCWSSASTEVRPLKKTKGGTVLDKYCRKFLNNNNNSNRRV